MNTRPRFGPAPRTAESTTKPSLPLRSSTEHPSGPGRCTRFWI